jgi:hypothetical protein
MDGGCQKVGERSGGQDRNEKQEVKGKKKRRQTYQKEAALHPRRLASLKGMEREQAEGSPRLSISIGFI